MSFLKVCSIALGVPLSREFGLCLAPGAPKDG
jgi:hypothetical protein